MGINIRRSLGILMAALMLCSLDGCGGKAPNQAAAQDAPASPDMAQSGEDLDVVVPDPADDDWYMEDIVYKGDNGHSLKVFFSDEGMLEFAVDGLSVYFISKDDYQTENNWRIYTFDDGTMIVYYPGNPAHLEIYGGDYAGLYEAETSSEE